ncbi:hypothetical protein IWQ62_000830 [Dispira parvispora]|uniref:BLOC-1-related complex subunit 7 n=1 Tax=Dispira parvispora TaxID=1520584 RepID=A0A9W8E987_9FUNG|nr:hypothetical protein IWQ62_000830 [Dispira parvispora]
MPRPIQPPEALQAKLSLLSDVALGDLSGLLEEMVSSSDTSVKLGQCAKHQSVTTDSALKQTTQSLDRMRELLQQIRDQSTALTKTMQASLPAIQDQLTPKWTVQSSSLTPGHR